MIRTQKDRKLQTFISRCVQTSPASATPQTSTDRRNKCSHYRKTTTGKRRCSPWWTDSSGTHRGWRNHLCRRSCNKCSPSTSTYHGGSTTTSTTGHSVQLTSQVADIQTSATAGNPAYSGPGRVDEYRIFAGRATAYHTDHNRRSIATRGSHNADLRNRTLVFGRLDRRPFRGICGRLGIIGDRYVRLLLPD